MRGECDGVLGVEDVSRRTTNDSARIGRKSRDGLSTDGVIHVHFRVAFGQHKHSHYLTLIPWLRLA